MVRSTGQEDVTARFPANGSRTDTDARASAGGGGGGVSDVNDKKFRIENHTALGYHSNSFEHDNGAAAAGAAAFCDAALPQESSASSKRRAGEGGARAAAAAAMAAVAEASGEMAAHLGPAEGPLRKRRARELQEAEAVKEEARAAAFASGSGDFADGQGLGNPGSSSNHGGVPTTMPGSMHMVQAGGAFPAHSGGSSGVLGDDMDGDGDFGFGGRRRGSGDGRVGGGGGGVHGVGDAGFVSFPNAHSAPSAMGEFLSETLGDNNNAVVRGSVPRSGVGSIAHSPMVSAAAGLPATAAAVGITPPPASFPLSPGTAMNASSAVGLVSPPSSMQMQMSVSSGLGGMGHPFMSLPSTSAGAGGAPHNPSSGGLAVSSASPGSGVYSHSYNFLPVSGHSLMNQSASAALSPEAEAANAAVAAAAAAAASAAAFASTRPPPFSSSGGFFQTMTSMSSTAPTDAGGTPSDFDGGLGAGGGGGGALAPLAAIFLASPSSGMAFSGGSSTGSLGGRTVKAAGHQRKNSRDAASRKLGASGGETPRRNRSRPTCTADGCQQRPLFGIEGTKQAIFCSQHKAPGMTNVLCRRCEVESCKHQPSFAVEGSRAVRCATHKTPGMVNVAAPRCKSPGCMVCPSFGKQGERKASFCATHRREGDVDLVTRRCHHEGCIHRPVFGHPPEKKAFYCASHKLEGMVNVFAPRCAHPDCTHQPSYGLPGSRRSTHCGKHRTQHHENKR